MAKKKTKTEKYVVLESGEKHILLREDGRYYVCGDGGDLRFRKANVTVETVEIKPEPVEEAGKEPEEE